MKIEGGRFLIVGGASLSGSHIADSLLASGASLVRCFDNFSLGSPDSLQHMANDKRAQVIRGDMLRLTEVIDATDGIDGVFLVAAYLAGPIAADLAAGLDVNTRGVFNVLEACRINGVKRLVHSSSVGVYGNAAHLHSITEDTPYMPNGVGAAMSIYSASKILGEALCRFYAERFGLQFAALRYSSVYGPRQHSHSINALPIVEICESLLAGKPPIIYGDGEEVHDYLYVGDLARANLLAMQSDRTGEAVTIASGKARSINDIANALRAITKSTLKPEHRDPGSRLSFTVSRKLNYSVQKANEVFDWRPEVSLEEGLARFVAWRCGS
jgi:UDP-glucose 4-epimerase